MPESNFIDYVKIMCRSGRGGNGSAHLHRGKYMPKGGPDGGDGGRGGDVVLRASTHVSSLVSLYFDPHLFAEDGVPGSGRKCYGRRGIP